MPRTRCSLAIAQPPATNQARPTYRSSVVIHDLSSGTSKVLHEADGVWEAPNWSRDGRFLLVNSGGRLYRIAVDGSSGAGAARARSHIRANNDHDYSPDGARSRSRRHRLRRASHRSTSPTPTAPTIVWWSPPAPSYFHGWSPDGKFLAFVANRDNKQYDVYRVPAAGGEEQRLTFRSRRRKMDRTTRRTASGSTSTRTAAAAGTSGACPPTVKVPTAGAPSA